MNCLVLCLDDTVSLLIQRGKNLSFCLLTVSWHVTVSLNTKEKLKETLAFRIQLAWQEICLIVITNYPSYLIAIGVRGACIDLINFHCRKGH